MGRAVVPCALGAEPAPATHAPHPRTGGMRLVLCVEERKGKEEEEEEEEQGATRRRKRNKDERKQHEVAEGSQEDEAHE